jgi:hypothetical protein
MNVLNVRYDVYGGVPDDLALSELPLSITVSGWFGIRPFVFRAGRDYTVFWSAPDNSKYAIAP